MGEGLLEDGTRRSAKRRLGRGGNWLVMGETVGRARACCGGRPREDRTCVVSAALTHQIVTACVHTLKRP